MHTISYYIYAKNQILIKFPPNSLTTKARALLPTRAIEPLTTKARAYLLTSVSGIT